MAHDLFHAEMAKYQTEEKLVLITYSSITGEVQISEPPTTSSIPWTPEHASHVRSILQRHIQKPSADNGSDDDESNIVEADGDDGFSDEHLTTEQDPVSSDIVHNIPELQLAHMAFHLKAQLILCLDCQEAVPASHVSRHRCGSQNRDACVHDAKEEDIIAAILRHPAIQASSLSKDDIFSEHNWRSHPAFQTTTPRPPYSGIPIFYRCFGSQQCETKAPSVHPDECQTSGHEECTHPVQAVLRTGSSRHGDKQWSKVTHILEEETPPKLSLDPIMRRTFEPFWEDLMEDLRI
ncbi:hypothetical protein C8F01DRAFT_1279910 [Mycena amicta]|nr:hypothetical protein C8F01DRAFT_1279910 [Mycena amicta]